MNLSPPYSNTMKEKKGSKNGNDDNDDHDDNDDTLEDVTDQETIKLFSSVENQQFQTPPRLLSVFSKEDIDHTITDETYINNQNNNINETPTQEDFENLDKTTISHNLVPNSTLLNISTDSDWLNLRDYISTLKRHPYHIDILSDSSKVIQSLESATNHICCNTTTVSKRDVDFSKGEVDVSKGEVAPWPQEFQDYIEGLENVINAVKNTQSCSERLCKFAEKSIRTSLRNEIFTHGTIF